MKTLLSLVLFVAGSASLLAQAPIKGGEETSGPRIEFESKTVDYGTIKQNAERHREIKFTNTGDAPLMVSACSGSCGCTVPTCPKEPIAPGESSVIKVKYDTNRLGSFRKTVTVRTNAVNGEVSTITIKGNVLTPEQWDAQNVKNATDVDTDVAN